MAALPPLAALRAFEAAARHLSFKHAAAELGVTPTAVSHQIRLLEETVGTRLFVRKPRQVRLTEAGNRLFPVFHDAFSAMSDVLGEVRRNVARQAVTVSTTTAFATGWLVPRTLGFNLIHPDITLRIQPDETVVDLHSGAADCAIRYGGAPFPSLICEHLTEDRFLPVCSPKLDVRTPEDLKRQTLLHSVWHKQDAFTPSWQKWCLRAGLDGVDTTAGTVLTTDSHVIQSAIAGQGVALLGTVLVQEALENGLLTQPFGPELEGNAYYFVYPAQRAKDMKIQAIREWLFAEMPPTAGT
ncbi:LysR substrate-binding domain-containing protein [Roseibium sp. Sym1]|uniref:LysR substrate-binding domain-containing protein n=1 Tax=Roseibium sp. Sym1 TaxID=3016006 RepID=UPI0022B4FB2F|nr:LysR substrate-binding domain-containing protein [Roseibium sp. Sym1]